MIEKLNSCDNLLGVLLMVIGVATCALASHLHDATLSQSGAIIVGAGAMAFKGRPAAGGAGVGQ